MENKRSRGITIIAWLIIITSGLSLLLFLSPSSYQNKSGLVLIDFIFRGAIVAYSLVLGISILSLKEWARRQVFLVMIISIILQFINLNGQYKDLWENAAQTEQVFANATPEEKLQYEQEKTKMLRQIEEAPLEKREALQKRYDILINSPEGLSKAYFVVILIVGIGGILWNFLVMFFFTRPKVKEQFNYH